MASWPARHPQRIGLLRERAARDFSLWPIDATAGGRDDRLLGYCGRGSASGEDRSRQASLEAPRPWVLLSGLTPPVFHYPGGFRLVAFYARDNPVYHVRP